MPQRGNNLLRLGVLFLVIIMAGATMLAEPSGLWADDDTYASNNPQNRPGGALIKDPATQKVYLVEGGTKRPIQDSRDLASHRYTGWIGIHDVSADELSKLPENPAWWRAREGTVFRNQDTLAIYVINELSPGLYEKRYVTGNGWNTFFTSCGSYGFTDVPGAYLSGYVDGTNVDPAYSLRPDGQLVKTSAGSTTVYNG